MTKYEQQLINNGWTKNVKTKDGYRPATDNDYLSTMGVIDFRYLKDNKEIVFGLGEKDKPPMLISPRQVIDDGVTLRLATSNEIELI